VEAKTAALFGPLMEEWGEDGTDDIPQRVIVQSYVHMACTGTDSCHVVSFIGGRGFAYHCIEKDDELMQMICEEAKRFWTEHVVANVPPADITPSRKIIRRVRRTPDKIVKLDDDLVNRWLDSKAEVSMAKEAQEMIETEMLAVMDDAEAGQCSVGMVTFFASASRRLDSRRLKEEKPEIAKEFTKISESRTLRFKKPKKKAS
jgi:predicted phage-related endonuclease